jgi:hypothetical protein
MDTVPCGRPVSQSNLTLTCAARHGESNPSYGVFPSGKGFTSERLSAREAAASIDFWRERWCAACHNDELEGEPLRVRAGAVAQE